VVANTKPVAIKIILDTDLVPDPHWTIQGPTVQLPFSTGILVGSHPAPDSVACNKVAEYVQIPTPLSLWEG
jgi:hypothetical protein